jgi:hypothetical protein
VAASGSEQLLCALLSNAAIDVNALNDDRNAPLHYFVQNFRFVIVVIIVVIIIVVIGIIIFVIIVDLFVLIIRFCIQLAVISTRMVDVYVAWCRCQC